jgi:hypothetical protein
MAVAYVSPANQNSVSPALKGPQNVVRGYRGRAHDPNRTNIARILHATHACQISGAIGTPVAHKRDYPGLKTVLFHIALLKYKLVRFAHNWNVGILEHWNIGFWENGKLGYCKIPLDRQ